MPAAATARAPIPKAQARLCRSLIAIPFTASGRPRAEEICAFADALHIGQGGILLITDQTEPWKQAQAEFRQEPRINVMLSASKGGGACRAQAAFMALTLGSDFLLYAPVAPKAETVYRMAEAIEEADAVLAGGGSGTPSLQETWARRWLTMLTGVHVAHPLAQYQIWRVPILRRLPFLLTAGNQYEFQTSLLFYALRAGARVAEIREESAAHQPADTPADWLRSAWVPLKLVVSPWRGPQPSL